MDKEPLTPELGEKGQIGLKAVLAVAVAPAFKWTSNQRNCRCGQKSRLGRSFFPLRNDRNV